MDCKHRQLVTRIVIAYVSNNAMLASDLDPLISSLSATLARLAVEQSERVAAMAPAVPIKDSVARDFIICLEDGKKLKMLKRYLRTNYDMSPEEYRERWNLPSDYPMVAPNYAEKRRELAKKIGLGRAPGQKRGRRKKTAE